MARKKISEIDYSQAQGSQVSFSEFYSVYAVLEGFDHIPAFHHDMISFLENDEEWLNDTAVMQCFRNASKSSLVASWVVWKLSCNPQLIFLIQSADNNTAEKMVADIQKILSNHPHASHLLSAKHTWTSRGVRVKGATSGRNLSVAARGIFSNVTGGRADIIIFDDTEVPRNSGSEELRTQLRNRVSESAHLLNPHGKKLFIGTPHASESLYPEVIDKGASSFRIPLLENLEGEFPSCIGTSNWPERWPLDLILKKQNECTGRGEFMSQYQLIAVSSEDSHLDPGLLKTYTAEPELLAANGSTLYRIDGKKITSICAFWDPSMSKAGGDSSVVAVVFCTQDGCIYIHRTVGVTGDADAQCLAAKKLLLDFNVPVIYIETNGIGNYLPQIMLKHTRGLGIGVSGKHTSAKKSESIMAAYETPLAAGILYVHESVLGTKFISQLRDFNPRSMRGSDDFIDAPAKGIALLPVSIGRGTTNTAKGFTPYRQHGEAMEIQRDYA